jgi:hypothetical protein
MVTTSNDCCLKSWGREGPFAIDGIPFSILMKQAVAIKVARSAPSRVVYDSYPTFFQRTLLPCAQVREAQANCDFETKYKVALQLRERGNTLFRHSNFGGALDLYEKACAVFVYLENTNPNWINEVSSLVVRAHHFAFSSNLRYKCDCLSYSTPKGHSR